MSQRRRKVDKRSQVLRHPQPKVMLSRGESLSIWPGPVITLDRCPALAILEGVKHCENRPFNIKGRHGYNMEDIPIGIHIKKNESKTKVVKFLNQHPIYKTQLLCGGGEYSGMTPGEFYVKTCRFAGKIVGFMRCDNHPDPDINYVHASYPVNRGFIWYIHEVFQFRYPIGGFQGGQTWKYIKDRDLLIRYMRQYPV